MPSARWWRAMILSMESVERSVCRSTPRSGSAGTLDRELEQLEAKVEQARQRKQAAEHNAAEQLRDRRAAWASTIVDTWSSDFDAGTEACETARQTFTASVMQHGLGVETMSAYLAWERSYRELAAQHQRLTRAFEYRNRRSFTDAVPVVHDSYRPLPSFDAVNQAIEAALPAIRQQVSDNLNVELAAVDEGR
jgi:hypothetical protein